MGETLDDIKETHVSFAMIHLGHCMREQDAQETSFCIVLLGISFVPVLISHSLQIKRNVLQETKLELEILEKNAQEKKLIDEKEKTREEARLNLLKGLDDQIK